MRYINLCLLSGYVIVIRLRPTRRLSIGRIMHCTPSACRSVRPSPMSFDIFYRASAHLRDARY